MITNLAIGNKSCNFDLPNVCPHCGTGIIPNVISTTDTPLSYEYGITFFCPKCSHIFFARYWLNTDAYDYFESRRIAVYPSAQGVIPIPEQMNSIFPDFYQVYTQAYRAEEHGLDEITGMAYRKALEILVKSYLIEMPSSNKDQILAESLGNSIARIPYPKIHSLAKAASWIGNDQTHIVQKNPDYGINDMKGFTLALCHLILAEKEADKALSLISTK